MFGDTAAATDSSSRLNKNFVRSSTHTFQENCIKTAFCSSRTPTKQIILYLLAYAKTTIIQQQFCND